MLRSSLRKFYCRHPEQGSRNGISASQMTTDMSICRNHDHHYHYSCLTERFLTRVTRLVSLVQQKYLIVLEHMRSPLQCGSCCPIFSFCGSLFVLVSFNISNCFNILRFTVFYQRVSIFKLFFQKYWKLLHSKDEFQRLENLVSDGILLNVANKNTLLK